MEKKQFVNILLGILLLMAGCYPEPSTEEPFIEPRPGFRPVYGEASDLELKLVSSRIIQNPGKIYVYGNYLLINERELGIHIYDNSNPAAPVELGFIQVIGNFDMAVKNSLLYADQLGDIICIDVSDFQDPVVTGTLPLNDWKYGVPPPSGSSFECIDPSKGTVISWTATQQHNFDCYALY